jgi:hypothetical protein
MRRASSFALVTVALAMVAMAAAPAGAATPRVFPPGSQVRGTDMQTWVEEWSRYAFEPGLADNPLVNPSDCDLSVKMVDGVIFLPASGGGFSKVVCTIPTRHPMLVTPGGYIAVNPTDGTTLDEIRATTDDALAQTSQVRVFVDGTRVEDIGQYLTSSGELFDLNVPADTILCCDLQPGVTDAYIGGWFLMLKPFWKEGTHRIRLHDAFPGGDGSTVPATIQFVLHVQD